MDEGIVCTYSNIGFRNRTVDFRVVPREILRNSAIFYEVKM